MNIEHLDDCHSRWIAFRPEGTRLRDLECPKCGKGYVIETGETYGGKYDN